MTEEQQELLSAFLDGDDVNGSAILDLLETSDGCDAACDMLRMRALLRGDDRPSAGFYERIGPVIRQRRHWTKPGGWRVAASLLVAVAGGVWIGLAVTERRADPAFDVFHSQSAPEGPPVPVRVVEFQRGVDWEPNP